MAEIMHDSHSVKHFSLEIVVIYSTINNTINMNFKGQYIVAYVPRYSEPLHRGFATTVRLFSKDLSSIGLSIVGSSTVIVYTVGLSTMGISSSQPWVYLAWVSLTWVFDPLWSHSYSRYRGKF